MRMDVSDCRRIWRFEEDGGKIMLLLAEEG